MDGYEVCRRLKQDNATRLIPIVLLTALNDEESKVKGIEAGADDFISKPFSKIELFSRVKSLIRVKRLNSSLTSIENVLFSMANMVEAKDSYTQGHIERVAHLAVALGRKMGLAGKELEALKLGGILHDLGKLGIPCDILNKPGSLTSEEWEIMKKHPKIGHTISLPLRSNLGQALDIIRGHHEKMDGSGYPDGKKGDEICMGSRIMAVVDIYDALITDRPYRRALQEKQALEVLLSEAEQGKLDKKIVEGLIKLLRGHPTN
jgi:putative two-component system response regulator